MFQIEPVQESDLEQWQTLYRAYADFYQRPMNDAILARVWSWIADETRDFHCLIARQGSTVVALLHFRSMPSPLRGQMIGFADDLYIQPASRGTGITQAMVAALRAHGVRQGWPIVRWITAHDNYRAMGVYDQFARKTRWQTYEMDCAGPHDALDRV